MLTKVKIVDLLTHWLLTQGGHSGFSLSLSERSFTMWPSGTVLGYCAVSSKLVPVKDNKPKRSDFKNKP